jgi:MFS family permease
VLLYCISIVDRYALSLLAEPISQSLGITNTQLGVLFGVGFGVVYSIAGLGLAHWVDRQRRVPLIAPGVVVWSLCTMLSGFADGFLELLLCRSGVVAWPLLGKLWYRSGQWDALVLLLATGMGASLGAIALVGIGQSLVAVRCAVGVAMFGISATALLPPLIIQSAAPGRVRGRLIAINLMASTLIGLAIGPPLAAGLAEALYAGPRALGYAMTTIAAFAAPSATAAVLLMRKQYVIALKEALVRESAIG